MTFTKMHGAGNDYIYVDCFNQQVKNPARTAIALSRYHYGVGGDGLVLICPSQRADCFMDIYNADGSRAKMCGNAVRCTAKYLFDRGRCGSTVEIDTLSGIKSVEIFAKNKICTGGRVNMGKPVLNGRQIPTRFGKSVVRGEKISVLGKEYEITCLSMGNPHCVVFCDNADSLPLDTIGRAFEHHEMFPQRINTEFVSVTGENRLKFRVWERGSGETLACGTGACAAAVAAVINGLCKRQSEIYISASGGELSVLWSESGTVYLSGGACEVFSGEVSEIDF